jgi:hypothetical protein
LVPDRAGEHLAVRLDCLLHGPQLMWTPFGDDAERERPSMEWSRAGLEAAGFEGFVRFAELKAAKVPPDPGIYVVLRPSVSVPEFLERTVAGDHHGRDQSVSISLLREKWVPGAEVVYIGKANARKPRPGRAAPRPALRTRLAEYRRLGEGKDSPHRGGLYIWQLADYDDLLVCWKTLPDEFVKTEETRLIAEFVAQYGRWPFANRKD